MKSLEKKTINNYLLKNNKKFPQKKFLYCPHLYKSTSYSEFLKKTQSISYFLTKFKKQKKGSKICALLDNSLFSVELMIGTMISGLTYVPLNLLSGEDQLKYVVEHCDTNLIFTNYEYFNLAKKIIKGIKRKVEIIITDQKIFLKNLYNFKKLTRNNVKENTDALLMYTSGTTGKPKGVLLTHKNLICGGLNVMISHNLKFKDKALCVLPTYHINGLIVTIIGPLVSSGSVVVCKKFSVTNFWSYIEKYKCTWFSVVPTIISALINKYNVSFKRYNLKSLKFGRSASSALPPDVHKNFEKKFRISIIETMGLTETCAPILSNPINPKKRKYGSPGKPYGNYVKIFDVNYKELKPNIIGQISVKGSNVMTKYYKNPIETKKSFFKKWFLTGDLGFKDKDGFVFVKGRIKELIIKGGENISPIEIDEVLYKNENVLDAACFPVKCKHYGEDIEAAVVLKNKKLNENQLIKFCKKFLPKFKVPKKIHILKELPKGSSGKIQRLKISSII